MKRFYVNYTCQQDYERESLVWGDCEVVEAETPEEAATQFFWWLQDEVVEHSVRGENIVENKDGEFFVTQESGGNKNLYRIGRVFEIEE